MKQINPEYKAAFEYARLSTAYHSKSFYISAKMLPRDRRNATYALYGFCRHMDNLIDNPRERSMEELVQEADFLAEELRIAHRTGESEHPVIQAYIQVALQYSIPIEYPLDLIEGVKMDLRKSNYKTFDELYLFAYRVAGVVGLMMTYVLGYKSKKAFAYAEKLGIAMQLTNILRDIKEDKNMGRIYLPEDELAEFGLDKSDVFAENMSPAFHKFMKFQVGRAQKYYDEANQGIKLLTPKSRFAIYSSSKIYNGILKKIEARNFNPFLGRVFISQVKKIGILMREVLRSRIEHLQESLFPAQYKILEDSAAHD